MRASRLRDVFFENAAKEWETIEQAFPDCARKILKKCWQKWLKSAQNLKIVLMQKVLKVVNSYL